MVANESHKAILRADYAPLPYTVSKVGREW
jgi:hypothetical protein